MRSSTPRAKKRRVVIRSRVKMFAGEKANPGTLANQKQCWHVVDGVVPSNSPMGILSLFPWVQLELLGRGLELTSAFYLVIYHFTKPWC